MANKCYEKVKENSGMADNVGGEVEEFIDLFGRSFGEDFIMKEERVKTWKSKRKRGRQEIFWIHSG